MRLRLLFLLFGCIDGAVRRDSMTGVFGHVEVIEKLIAGLNSDGETALGGNSFFKSAFTLIVTNEFGRSAGETGTQMLESNGITFVSNVSPRLFGNSCLISLIGE